MKRNANTPVLLPALGILLGTCLSRPVAPVPLAACILLLTLGLSWRRPLGLLVAGLAVGLVHGELRWNRPSASLAEVDLERPAEVLVSVRGHPVRRDAEVVVLVEAREVRQGTARHKVAFGLWMSLPETAEVPRPGSVLAARGYLRRSMGYANADHGPAAARPGSWRLPIKSSRLVELVEPPGWLDRLAGRLRKAAEQALEEVGNGRSNPWLDLARALLLADRAALPESWEPTLRRMGLAHLLAVSGLHVGLLAGLVLLAGRGLLPRPWRLAAALLAIALYALLLGPRPAVIRAAVMAALALAALGLERPPQTVNALAWGGLVLILPRPAVVGELGFQLSFAATAGVLTASHLAQRWTALPTVLRVPLAVSFSAQIATLPFLVPKAGTLHPLAPVFNLVAVPWLGVVLLVAFPWLALAMWSAPLAARAMPALDVLAGPVDLLASFPPLVGQVMPVALATPAAVALAALLAGAAWWPRLAARATLCLALLALVGSAPPSVRQEHEAELVVFDVGQGDAILLRHGERAILVDGGGWPAGDLGGRVLLPALAELGVRRLDAMVLTHPDRDHCQGLVEVARYLPVDEVWMSPGWGDSPCARRLLVLPRSRWRPLWEGQPDPLALGDWRLRVLHPPAGRLRVSPSANDRSLVLHAEVHGRHVLLLGDLESEGERRLAGDWDRNVAIDLLKVAHHGSKTSTTAELLRAVSPRLAIISAGRNNPYGHPAPEVVARLLADGHRVLRTDLQGRIRLAIDHRGQIIPLSLRSPPFRE